MKKPEFLKSLADVEVTEGSSVKLRVKVKGQPQPRITWFKDGTLLKHSRACRLGEQQINTNIVVDKNINNESTVHFFSGF